MYEASIEEEKMEYGAETLKSGSVNVWIFLVSIQNLTLTSVKHFSVARNILFLYIFFCPLKDKLQYSTFVQGRVKCFVMFS